MIPVILVTGFLGSGKTTFLKAFAQRHSDWNMVFLVNELAEISVDGRTLEETGLLTHSVVGGSLFCECKAGDFVRILRENITAMHAQKPLDAVVVETSGMANPDAIGKLVQQYRLDDTFEVRRVITLVSPLTFLRLIENLPVVGSQISSCDAVLINKIDLATPSQIESTRQRITQLNPDAEVHMCRNAQVDLPLLQSSRNLPERALAKCSANPFSTRILRIPFVPELSELERMIDLLPPWILRAKGHVQTDQGWRRVEKTVDSVEIESCPVQPHTEFIIIVHDNDEHRIDRELLPHPEFSRFFLHHETPHHRL